MQNKKSYSSFEIFITYPKFDFYPHLDVGHKHHFDVMDQTTLPFTVMCLDDYSIIELDRYKLLYQSFK